MMNTSHFVDQWGSACSAVLSQLAGETVACEPVEPAAAYGAAANAACFESTEPLRGSVALVCNDATALYLARLFMGEPTSADAPLTPEYRDAIAELLRQIAGTAALNIKSATGKCELTFTSAEMPAWMPAETRFLRLSRGADSLMLQLLISSELQGALSAAGAPPPPSSPVANAEEAAPESRNIDLLLGVELRVRLRFGRRSMPLKEIIALNAGSVVELEQHVDEPAELLVDDRVLARGEVVVVDGNYGLRVTEIVAPDHRLTSLSS